MRKLVAAMAGSILLCSAQQKGAIRKTDFRNFRYIPACGSGKEAVVVKNGEFQRDHPPEARLWMKVLSVRYGDLDRDGVEEAVVHTACNSGGSGEYTQVFVYGMKGGRTVAIAGLKPGDRALGGIAETRVAAGNLVVTRKEGKAACCPEELVTTTYRLRAGKLVPVGVPARVKYPAQVQAAPAKTQLPLTLPAGEWLLLDLGGKGVLEGVRVTIQFSEEGKVSGSGGCNHYSGTAKLEGGKIAMGPLAATMRACTAEVMDQESAYLETLGNTERAVVEGPRLLVYSKLAKQPLKFTRVKP